MNGESIIAKLEAALDRLEMMADHCARKKALMINKVTDQEQKDSIISDYRTWWARGNIFS